MASRTARSIYERTERAKIDETNEDFKLLKKVTEHDLNKSLRSAGLKFDRIDTDTKRWRLLIAQGAITDKDGTATRIQRDWYAPTPFGKNWYEYWTKLMGTSVTTFGIATALMMVTYVAYDMAERFHDKYSCRSLWRWGNPQCQLAKFVRSTAETCVFRWYVYFATVVGARLLAWGSGLGGALLNR